MLRVRLLDTRVPEYHIGSIYSEWLIFIFIFPNSVCNML